MNIPELESLPKKCLIVFALWMLTLALISILVTPAFATGPNYVVGVTDSITINCANPTARTDGTTINWSIDGGHVDWFIGTDSTMQALPVATARMGLGCQPTVVNLNQLTTGRQYYLYARAYDAQGRVDGPSANLPFMRVSGTPTVSPNLALKRPVAVSSIESSTYVGSRAVDGLLTTRWASRNAHDPEWIRVDLGAIYSVLRVVVKWEKAYATTYEVQGSRDGTTWVSLYATTSGVGGIVSIVTPANTSRYIRVYGKRRSTQWGYSIWELEVYGK